jgi:hypothetical protein
MNYTLTYSEGVQGWTSFFSFYPDWMIGMNNYFYTFKGGNIYRHNVNETRNNFYGQQYSSSIESVFNTSPLENKLFKTLNLEGDDTWTATMETDLQYSGFIQDTWFEKKEQAWFAFVRNLGTVPASPAEYPLRSVNGIGRSLNVSGPAAATVIDFQINPSPIAIGSILSIGDYVYYCLPPTYSSPVLCGIVTNIVVDYPSGDNYIVVDTTAVLGSTVPPIDDAYIMYIKNSVAESHGVLGHYCVFTLENSNTNKVELFAAESEIMKSYP